MEKFCITNPEKVWGKFCKKNLHPKIKKIKKKKKSVGTAPPCRAAAPVPIQPRCPAQALRALDAAAKEKRERKTKEREGTGEKDRACHGGGAHHVNHTCGLELTVKLLNCGRR